LRDGSGVKASLLPSIREDDAAMASVDTLVTRIPPRMELEVNEDKPAVLEMEETEKGVGAGTGLDEFPDGGWRAWR
jgi:hypothetical protein